MGDGSRWEVRRYATLLVVLALHALVFMGLLLTSPSRSPAGHMPLAVELLYLPPTASPRIRADNPRPHFASPAVANSIDPPPLESKETSPLASERDGGGSGGAGHGVDWAAEARRALQAFEIRSHERIDGRSNPGPPTDRDWWPQAQHHAGERYKTANGDWIVWIDARCYQVTSTTSATYGAPPPTVCARDRQAPNPNASE